MSRGTIRRPVVVSATAHRSAVRVGVGGLQIEMSPTEARDLATQLVDSIQAAEQHSEKWKEHQ